MVNTLLPPDACHCHSLTICRSTLPRLSSTFPATGIRVQGEAMCTLILHWATQAYTEEEEVEEEEEEEA
jgi:hypothetical protein